MGVPLKDELLRRALQWSATFIETGTFEGATAKRVLEIGFKRVLTCEMAGELFDNLTLPDSVETFFGDSIKCLPIMLEKANGNCVIFLDAHMLMPRHLPPLVAGDGVHWTRSPVMVELGIIAKSPFTHLIIIDDVDQCETAELDFISVEQLKHKLFTINPSYRIMLEDTNHGPNSCLVAYPAGLQ